MMLYCLLCKHFLEQLLIEPKAVHGSDG